MAILQEANAVFYHPLDDPTEFLESQAWSGDGTFPAGRVSTALGPVAGPAPAALTNAPAFGAESEFTTGFIGGPGSVTALSATKFVVVYLNGSVGQNRVKVGTVSGTDITFGPSRTLGATGTWGAETAVGTLSATQVAFAFANASGAQVAIGTVSGTDITLGPTSQFLPAFGAGSDSAKGFTIAVLSATSVVVSYDNELSTIGASIVATISGLAITFGAESQFMPADADVIFQLSSASLSASTFVIAYRDRSDSDHGTAKVGTVVVTSIVFGAESEFLVGTAGSPSVAAFSATKIVVAYGDGSDANHGTAKIGTVSGTNLTFGAEAEFLSVSAAFFTAVSALGLSTFVVAYQNTGSNSGESAIGTVSGTDIVFGTEVQFLGTSADSIAAVALSTTKFVVTYRDIVDTSHGTAKVGSTVAYPTVVGGEHVTFASWSRSPNADPPSTTTIPPTTTAP